MKKRIACLLACILACTSFPVISGQTPTADAASVPYIEQLDRGITAINTGKGMLVSWRFLANDADDAVFELYRNDTLIYTSEAGMATCYLDAEGSVGAVYRVDTIKDGQIASSDTCYMQSDSSYFRIDLDPPTGSCTYVPLESSIGDADGDGQMEFFIKWEPSNAQDNSRGGVTDKVYIDCIKLDGTRLWRIDLGTNIRAGNHYTQMLVADYDSDGYAELCCKTADGTTDAKGNVIGDPTADYHNSEGYILDGPEYYSLFDGRTGEVLDTVDYEPQRGIVDEWGDDYGNRVDRFLGAVVYLDGVHPSAVTVRGYYTRMTACAYDVVDKKLVKRWYFDTGNDKNAAGYGDGNHNCMPADVDGDGKQELILGATCLDDDGTVLWCTNRGHGDGMHVGDLVPDRPGLEAYMCHEVSPYGVSLLDAKTGEIIFHKDGTKDTGRCCADNVWTGNDGAEFWGLNNDVYDESGTLTSMKRPSTNFLCWWDGDLEREILDYTKITKVKSDGTITTLLDSSRNCTTDLYSMHEKPVISGDILGDWREEVVWAGKDLKSIYIYCSPYATDTRLTTLMHDLQYRTQLAGECVTYNMPPHTSFYLGTGSALPERPVVTVKGSGNITAPSSLPYRLKDGAIYTIKNLNSGLYLGVQDGSAALNANVQQSVGGVRSSISWKAVAAGNNYYVLVSQVGDGNSLAMDVSANKKEDGTNIALYTYRGGNNQQFKFMKNSDSTFTIVTKVTGDASCIEVNAKSTEAGANVHQWTVNGGANQKWILEEVTGDPMRGDVNIDGSVSVLDIVMLQKYLLAKCKLTAEQGEMADMIEDSYIDAFDLAALKRYVTSQNPAPENSVKFEEINGSTWSIPDGLAGKTLVCTFSGEAGYSASFGYGCWDTTRNDGAGDWVQDDSTFLGNVTFDENNEASVSFVVPENCYNMQIQVYYYADHAVEDASLKRIISQ